MLGRIIQEAWNFIEPDYLENLISSMLTRFQAVIDTDEGGTRY